MNPMLTAVLCGLALGLPLLALSGRMRSGTLLRLERGSAWLFFMPLLLASVCLYYVRYTSVYASLLLLSLLGIVALTQGDKEQKGRAVRRNAVFFLIFSFLFSDGLVALSAMGKGGEAVRKFAFLVAEHRAAPHAYPSGSHHWGNGTVARSAYFPSDENGNSVSEQSIPSSSTAAFPVYTPAVQPMPARNFSYQEPRARALPATSPPHSSRVPEAAPYAAPLDHADPIAPLMQNDPAASIATQPPSHAGSLAGAARADTARWNEQSVTVPTRIESRQFDPIDIMGSRSNLEMNRMEPPKARDSHLDIARPLDPPVLNR